MSADIEGWKDMPEYEGLYRVSTHGRVCSSITGRCIIPWTNNRGYLCVKLYRKGHRTEYKVHQLVMLTFDPNGKTWLKCEVHHKDDDKTNNHFDNLQWCTRKKNMKYMHESKKNKAMQSIDEPF